MIDSTVYISGLDKKIVQQLDSVLINNLNIDPDVVQVLQTVTNPVKLSHLVKKQTVINPIVFLPRQDKSISFQFSRRKNL